MAVNLASKYSKHIQTIYVKESLVAGRLSQDYDFAGVKTVVVYTPTTVPMGPYTREGSNRYGTPTEMQDTKQELTLTQDRAFALTIDKGNNEDQMGAKSAGKMLQLQIAERAVPEFDKYALGKMAAGAGKVNEGAALTKSTICDRISSGTEWLDDAEVPETDRTLWITAAGYKLLKHSEEFMAVEKIAGRAIAKGEVGAYDNMTVIKVPKSRMPDGVNFIIAHRNAATAPVKMSETKIHQDPPGISGALLEGREYYDCFVFNAKKNGVYCDKNTSSGT